MKSLALAERGSSIRFRRGGPRRHRLHCLLLVLTLMGSGACGGRSQTQQSNDFGPLAVIDDPGTGTSDALGGTGPIRIDDRCVTVTVANGSVLLLVWRSGEVRWDEKGRNITFSSGAVAEAKPITIRDGDTITVGGESLASEGEEQVKRDVVWIAKPNDTCTGESFVVNSVTT